MARGPIWTPEENRILIEHYATASEKELLQMLPGRTMEQCRYHASRLRRTEPTNAPQKRSIPWTSEEDEIIVKQYATASKEELLKLLPGRTWTQCTDRAITLQERHSRRNAYKRQNWKPWTPEEDKTLIEYWDKLSNKGLLTLLPGRTLKACQNRVQFLKRDCDIVVQNKPLNLYVRASQASKAHTDGKSGIPGVQYKEDDHAWVVEVMVLGNKIGLGQYRTPEQAVNMRRHAEELIDRLNAEGKLTPDFAATLTAKSFGKLLSTANTSGYTGVNWDKKQHSWVAKIGICKNGATKHIALGHYKNPAEGGEVFKVAKTAYQSIPNKAELSLDDMKDIILTAVNNYKR